MALSGTKALQAWCKRVTEGYASVNILNMTTSWRSGLAFCAIIHHHCPELIEFDSLDPDDVFGNNSLAFNVAEQHLGIPSLLDPQDMVECELLDRLSILTYLAQYFQAFSTPNSPIKANILPTGSNSSASSDLTDTAKLQMKNPLMGRLSDPCKQCSKSVFILERLNVGGKILHRTCFKCARCQDQLTLASFYETETGQFCCEVCPDEETREREKTLRVNTDLAKLMAGDSGESEEEDDDEECEEDTLDTDGSIMSSSVVETEGCQSNETGIAFTVEYGSLDSNIKELGLEETEKSIEICDTEAFKETTSDELQFEENNDENCIIVPKLEESDEIDYSITKNTEEIVDKVELSDETDHAFVEKICEEAEKMSDLSGEEVELGNITEKDSGNIENLEYYPDDKNPFGDDDDDESEVVSSEPSIKPNISTTLDNTVSLNPFGSDLDSEDDESNKLENCTAMSIPKLSTPGPSLNPFGSDLDSDEEMPGPSVSPSPSVRSTLVSRKKRHAPPPPSQTTPVPAPRLSLSNASRSSSPGSRSSLQRKAKTAPVPPAETAKRLKDVDNLTRRSQIMEDIRKTTSPTPVQSTTIPEQITPTPTMMVTSLMEQEEEEPNKADEGQWRKKKGPAPPRPLPPKRAVKKLERKAINQELFDIEVKQGGLERQGVKLEKSIREICAASDAEEGADRDSLGPEAEDLIIQLFDLVNEKNELFRRQTELIYMKKENRLEEMHADCEYQIRILMSKPECQRTDDDKISEERLINKLVDIVTQRSVIVDCLEMDRLRELDEDTAIEDHMSNYAAVQPAEIQKKGLIKILKMKRKKKKKDKDDEKDVDTSEAKEDQGSHEKPKKKSARKKLISLASKKLPFPHKK